MSFSSSANSQYFFAKISGIGPWVIWINWCKGHWCGSTYMAMRLSYISSKTGKKCIFCVFRLFLSLCLTASRPYRLSHTNALFASINPSNQRTNPWNFWEKILRIGGTGKWVFFLVGHFEFFLLHSHENMVSKNFSKFWWLP